VEGVKARTYRRTDVYLAAPLWTRLASEKAAFNSFVRRSASAMISGAVPATLSG
jgi:hypothetical protein